MAAPATTNEFLDLVRKSGVAEEKRLDAWLAKAKTTGLPAKPSEAAGYLVRDSILTTFQAEQILQGKWKRFTIGKYKVLERLGSGGMGSVYLCEHKLMRRRVAVKVLPAAKAQDEAALGRFYREARAVAALDHPNIVHAYDIDQDESLHFLVMEYVDGSSLQDIVKKTGPMDVSRACHYIRQAAQGLQHAHESGLIHRDIKPGNILVERTGLVKILDMGLARFFNDEDDVLTKKFDENVLGTADYLAPEQAVDSHEVDIRADIYSLGATFYYMLTARTPFGEGTVAQKLLWHQNRQPKPVTEFRAEVPPPLAAVLLKMMAKEPAQRYQRPIDIAEALEPFTQSEIGPPPDAEMPHLSPAAVGQGGGIENVDTAIVKGATGASVPKALQGMSSKSIPPAPAPSPAPPPARTAPTPSPSRTAVSPPTSPAPKSTTPPAPMPAPAPMQPAAVSAPAPPTPEEEEAPWENLSAADTEDLSAKVDTAPQGGKSARRMARASAVKNPRRAWIVFTLIGIGAVAVVVGLLVYAFWNGPGPGTTARKALQVSSSGSGPRTFRSVALALQSAEPGDVIQLVDSEHRENLLIEERRGIPTNVTIEAAPGSVVVWKSASSDEKLPILNLQRARNFKINGKGLTFDGAIDAKKRVKNLVLIYSEAAGLTIDGAAFTDFAASAIHVMNAAGTKEKPIRLVNLRTQVESDAKPEAAILFEAKDDSNPPQNRFIEVMGFDFPGVAATKEIGNAPNGEHVIVQK